MTLTLTLTVGRSVGRSVGRMAPKTDHRFRRFTSPRRRVNALENAREWLHAERAISTADAHRARARARRGPTFRWRTRPSRGLRTMGASARDGAHEDARARDVENDGEEDASAGARDARQNDGDRDGERAWFWEKFDDLATTTTSACGVDWRRAARDVIVGDDADEEALTRELMKILIERPFGGDGEEPKDVSGDWSFDKVEFDRESLRDVVDIVAAYLPTAKREGEEEGEDDASVRRAAREALMVRDVLMQQFNYISLCLDEDYADDNRELITKELLPLLKGAETIYATRSANFSIVARKAGDLEARILRLLEHVGKIRGETSDDARGANDGTSEGADETLT